jgi:hypothetical protein
MPSRALHTIKCHKLYGQDAEISLCIKAVTFYDEALGKKYVPAVLSLSQNAKKRLCFHHEKASSSETSVHFHQSTWRNISEASNLRSHPCENCKRQK